jgi:type IV pilus assembly protein PilA
MRRNQDGFTLVELLVVILIVGILSAVAVPAFLGQRARSHDTAAKTFARHAQSAMESHYHAGQTYAGATIAVLEAIEPSLKPARGITFAAPPTATLTATGYVLTVTSKTTNTFTITKTASGTGIGTVSRTCTRTNTKGGCSTSRIW